MSYGGTLHVADATLQSVLQVVRRFCGSVFKLSETVEWEVWTSYLFETNFSIYKSEDFDDVDGIAFERYSVVVSLSASHASARKKQLLQDCAVLIAERVGQECTVPWMVVVEM